MIKHSVTVVKWLSSTPAAIGVCTFCSREFKVPVSALTSLQEQFDRHKCERESSRTSSKPLRKRLKELLAYQLRGSEPIPEGRFPP